MSAGERLPGTPVPMHRWDGHGGVSIAGDTWGDPDAQLVMLLHGGGQTRHAWKGAGETLGNSGYHAVAFDARGHGDSDWAATSEEYAPDCMVEDLACVAKALGSDRPILVGASMGGGTSLLSIGLDKVDAAALVLVDMAPRIEPEGSRKIQEFMNQKPDGFDTLEEVAEAIANYQPHRKRPRNLDGLAKNVRLGANGKYVWHWDPKRRAGQRINGDYRDRLSAAADTLSLPTLLVRGGLSDVLSEAGAQSFLQQAPHAEYVNVKNAAHMVAGDRNDIFADSVIEFLKRVAPPR
ncbi:MAG: alpha/beta hydrolase [Rhodospirillaceae bacterium]|nr:alpha/beta hydrolase [Rhodospirillaceae bacterium]MDD9916584.1 alpha/beta hydrolase [Rhodospirillaceae bacterium]MDD9926411.1 alpha/beta hydrolase [Rhodospirillaceae bacterium]